MCAIIERIEMNIGPSVTTANTFSNIPHTFPSEAELGQMITTKESIKLDMV